MYTKEEIDSYRKLAGLDAYFKQSVSSWALTSVNHLPHCTTANRHDMDILGLFIKDENGKIGTTKDGTIAFNPEKMAEYRTSLSEGIGGEDVEKLKNLWAAFDEINVYGRHNSTDIDFFKQDDVIAEAINFGIQRINLRIDQWYSERRLTALVRRLFADGAINSIPTKTRELLAAMSLTSTGHTKTEIWGKISGRKPTLIETYKLAGRDSSEAQKMANFLGKMSLRKRFPKKEEAEKLLKNYVKRRHAIQGFGVDYATWYKNLLATFTENLRDNWEATEKELKILRMLTLTRLRKRVVVKESHPFKSPRNAKRLRIVAPGLGIVHERLAELKPETNVKYGRLKQETKYNSLPKSAKAWIDKVKPDLPLSAKELVVRLRKLSTDIYSDYSNQGYSGYTILGDSRTKALTVSIGKKWYKEFSEKFPEARASLWNSLGGHYRVDGIFAHIRYVAGEIKIDGKWVKGLLIEEIQTDVLKKSRRGNLPAEAHEGLMEITKEWEYYALNAAIAKAKELRCSYIVMSTEDVQKRRWGYLNRGERAFAPQLYETLPRKCGFTKKTIGLRTATESKTTDKGITIVSRSSKEAEVELWYRKVKHDADGLIGRYGKATTKKSKQNT